MFFFSNDFQFCIVSIPFESHQKYTTCPFPIISDNDHTNLPRRHKLFLYYEDCRLELYSQSLSFKCLCVASVCVCVCASVRVCGWGVSRLITPKKNLRQVEHFCLSRDLLTALCRNRLIFEAFAERVRIFNFLMVLS